MNTPVIKEDGQGKMLFELMELFVTRTEKKCMNFMGNGMKHFILETKKQKKKENFGD